jgi:lysophospholipase L1-like esterase
VPSASAIAVVSVAAFAAGDSAASININPLGDSITFGVNDVAAEVGGYRFYYENLAASNPAFDLNFIGNRNVGTGTDTDHWAQSGGQAQNDRNLTTDLPSMLRAVHNVTAAPASDLSAFDPANGKLDAMFIHAGTNSVPGPIESGSLNGGGQFGLNNAFNSMKNLLLAGTTGVSADVTGATASFPTINNANGVHAQLNNAAVANTQSHVFVAGIIPAFSFGSLHNGIVDVYNGTGQYNNMVKNLLDTDPTLNDVNSSVTYHYVDMFSITVDELDLDWILSAVAGTTPVTDQDSDLDVDVDDLLALISPETDAGTDYVDWGLGFDESTWDEGALGTNETTFNGFNEDLIGVFFNGSEGDEGVHPTDLGYAIMANVWYNASVGVLVPEPSSIMLLMAGSSLIMVRRRRGTHTGA